MAPLRLGILGDFRLTLDDVGPIPELSAPRLQELLAFLVLNRRTPQPRRRTAFLLWPDTTETQALTNLRRELHHLRRALPDADRCLGVTSRTLHWRGDAPCRVDVAEFEEAMAAADVAREAGDPEGEREHLDRAVDVYRDDLLPSCYGEWIEAERERFRRASERALERLVVLCERLGDYGEAIRAAERLVGRDPLREAHHARLVDLHAKAGDRAAALSAYERAEELLERELGVEPGPALRQARAAAMDASGGPAVAAPRVVDSQGLSELPPLVGRAAEASALREWLGAEGRLAGAGASQALLLTGEPGIGKTRLLDALTQAVRDAGGRAIRGRGFEAEMVRPYGAWIDAFRGLPAEWTERSPELSFLLPGPGGSMPTAPARNRIFDAVAQWLSRMRAEAGPVAVLMDDIQWLDEASVALLHYISRVGGEPPVLLAFAARPAELEGNEPVSGLLRGLERSRRIRGLELGPMDREEIAALVGSIDSAADPDRVFSDSGGNPLFALEVAHALASRREGGDAVPLDDLVRDRLARLDNAARELITWAAALGRGFDPSTAARVAGRPLQEILPILERLERHGILKPAPVGGTAYDFGHDIVRRVAYESLSPPRRRLVHLRIARALDELGDPDGALAGEIAHHASLGGDAERAAAAAVTAGGRCLRIFAYAEATELALRGIEHTRSLHPSERLPLHLALLRVEIAAGARRPGGAAELDTELRGLVAEARALGSLREEASAHSLLSVLNYGREDFVRVHQSSLEAAAALGAVEPAPARDLEATARTLGQTGACLASIEREVERAEALLLEAESLASRAGIHLIDIPMGLGMVRHFSARCDEAVLLLQNGLRLARKERDHFRACEIMAALVRIALDNGAPDRAETWCRELLPVAAKLKEGSEAPFSRALAAVSRYARAEEGAEVELERALATLRRMNTARKLAQVQVHAAEADLAAGRSERGFRRSEEALEAARTIRHPSGIVRARGLLVRCARANNDPGRARAEMRRLRRELEEGQDLSARARQSVAELAPEHAAASRPAE